MAFDMEIGYQKWWPKAIGHYKLFLKVYKMSKNDTKKVCKNWHENRLVDKEKTVWWKTLDYGNYIKCTKNIEYNVIQ